MAHWFAAYHTARSDSTVPDRATLDPGGWLVPQSVDYLLAAQPTELERLQLQSRVWEPAGRELLASLPPGGGHRVLDVGCGVMGWLRVLSEWVGPTGSVLGTDVDGQILANARVFVDSERLRNVTLQQDDLFASRLAPGSFDLVHARFELAPLGRAAEQLAAHRRLVKPGGRLVLEEPDAASWRVNPESPAVQQLVGLILRGFRAGGGDFDAGRGLLGLLRDVGIEPSVEARVVALPPGHPYLRLPLQFAASLRPRLEGLVGKQSLDELIAHAEEELARPGVWGTTFTLIQAHGLTR